MKQSSRMLVTAAALFAGGVLPASAQYIADNHSWNLTCNPSGYQLKSKYPVSRFVEAGANSSTTEAIETIYLGKSCDAQHKLFGKGKWCWANGGFTVEFAKNSIGFPRQELACSNPAFDIDGCGC